MNRRHFLKAAALAAVAVPVAGVPAAMPVSDRDYVWVIKFRCKTSTGHGTAIVKDVDQAIEWYIRWTNMGYAVKVHKVPSSEASLI